MTMQHGPKRFLLATFITGIALLATSSVNALYAAQSSSTRTTSSWQFRDTRVDGRPVLQVVHASGANKRVTRDIAPDDLPILDGDCELDCRQSSVEGCYGKCLRGALQVLVFDEPRLTAFLAAATGSGQNFDRVIFKLGVDSGKLSRVGRTFGSGISDIQLSADGRFLAYRIGMNAGRLDGGWNLNVMDTQSGRELHPVERMYPAARNVAVIVDVVNYHWRDASTIVFTAVTRGMKKKPEDAEPKGRVAQYVYSVVEDRLVTARGQQLIP
jgi:hypothetical protein